MIASETPLETETPDEEAISDIALEALEAVFGRLRRWGAVFEGNSGAMRCSGGYCVSAGLSHE